MKTVLSQFAACTLILLASLTLACPSTAFAATKAGASAGQCKLKTDSGLGYSVSKPGKGAIPRDSDNVTIAYKGTLAANGKLFDESERADFGVGDVIPGFAEGLKLIGVGGHIRLCIPAELGYGATGSGPIPANSNLVFEVEILDVRKGPEPLAAADRLCTSKSASGLGITVVKPGAGGQPTSSDIVLINYKGYIASTRVPFDAGNSAPLPVSGVIPGFGEGLKLMQRGGSYKLCILPELAYGAKANGPIPPNSGLVFLIDLIDFKSLAEVQGMQPQPQ